MKKIFSFLLVIALLLCPVFAVGDANLDGGGGNMGDGTRDNYWNSGNDGVRVSIMEEKTTVCTFDLSNKDWSGTVEYHFGYKNKLYYVRSQQISKQTDYENKTLAYPLELPKIIMGDGTSNIEAIRECFTRDITIKYIAEQASMTYEELISGQYKLLIEPIAYFRFQGHWYAMTASEAATYNGYLFINGQTMVSSKMGSLTRCSLPLSMYLTENDMGLSAPPASVLAGSDSKDYRVGDENIRQYLGVGIVKFNSPPQPPEDEYGEYTYRTDIDVITSVVIENTFDRDMTPDTDDFVTFEIDGTKSTKQILCPAGENQLVSLLFLPYFRS